MPADVREVVLSASRVLAAVAAAAHASAFALEMFVASWPSDAMRDADDERQAQSDPF